MEDHICTILECLSILRGPLFTFCSVSADTSDVDCSAFLICCWLQVGGAGGGAAEEEAEAQQAAPVPASRPGEHHHRTRRHPGGRHQTSQYRYVILVS